MPIFTTATLLHVYYLNIASYETSDKINISLYRNEKGNRVVILDRKLYNNAIQETISGTSNFEKLKEVPTFFM